MRYINIFKNCKHFIPTFFLLLFFYQPTVSAKQKVEKLNGYGKASYDAAQPGKFMKTWLLLGPVPVSIDSINPGDALQQQVFKEESLSSPS